MQRINVTFVFEGNAPPIYLNVSIVTWIISDPASATEELSIRFFYESLQIAFPNNVLVSKFRGWSIDRLKRVFFTLPLRNFNQSML